MPSRFLQHRRRKVAGSFRDRAGYDVLLDAGTSTELSRFFRYASISVPQDFNLKPKAKDPTIVAVAQTNSKMIVTHDRRMDDYVRAHQAGRKLHKCLNGLVFLPNRFNDQVTRLGLIQNGKVELSFGGWVIFWFEVWNYNLSVDLSDAGWPKTTPLCECGKEAFVKHFGSDH